MVEIALNCYHCGLQCPNENISIDEKYFCCSGCKSVYQILSENSLCQYYDIDKKAGLKPKIGQFSFLENEEICSELLDFKNDNLSKITFYIPSIHCSSCLYLLENLNRINTSIERSTVDFLKKEVVIGFNHNQIRLKEIAELLTSIGYEPLINRINDFSNIIANSNRTLLTKLAIAGFCAGNIMLFCFPEYLGLKDYSFRILFGYLNILMALPVVFYSASGYFVSVYNSLKKRQLNIDFPILLSIFVALLAGIYQVLFENRAGYFDSLTGLIFFLLVGKWFQQKTHDLLSFERDYKSYFPLAVTKLIQGGQQQIALSDLQKGDKILVRNGEIIPSDSMLYKGIAKIDYSFVTGETSLESKEIGDLIYAGGKQMGSTIEMEVIKNVSQSYLTQLWNNDTFKKSEASRIQTFSNIVGKYFTISVLILAFSVAIYWQIHEPTKALNAFISVLIIACPCTLALSYPFALGNGMRLLANQNFYLKNAEVIEKMAKCDSLIFDKTGTLTTGEYHSAYFEGKRLLSVFEESLVAALVKNSVHPLAIQIQKILPPNKCFSIQNFMEIVGKGLQGYYDGFEIKIGSLDFLNLSKNEIAIKDVPITGKSFLAINGEYLGCFIMPSQFRNGIENAIKAFTENYNTYLLSGDEDTERAHLEKSFLIKQNLVFNCSPQAKLDFVKSLQKEGKKVIMLGDGLNDAGALKQADVGIAVTENTLNFTPMSDAILLAKSLSNLPKYLAFSKFGMKLIKYSYGFSLIYNCIGLYFAVQGSLSPIVAAVLMPLNSITLVSIASLGMVWGGKRILD